MQATIYVTEEAMATAIAIKDLTYYDRLIMSDDPSTDLTQSPGYFLKNANKLRLSPLPEGARIVVSLDATANTADKFTISAPSHLRGCIFDKAPNIPDQYAEIVTYWSGEAVNAQDCRAVHFQSPLNEYMVELKQVGSDDSYAEQIACDKLLSEGVVVSIIGLADFIRDFTANDFIELILPIDPEMVGIEPDAFRSPNAYGIGNRSYAERIYLNVADILRSPNPDTIFIDIIRSEMIDYGYVY